MILIDLRGGSSYEQALKDVAKDARYCRFCKALIKSLEFALVPVFGKLDNAIHRINRYPLGRVVCFVNIYLLDSDLSGG